MMTVVVVIFIFLAFALMLGALVVNGILIFRSLHPLTRSRFTRVKPRYPYNGRRGPY